MSRRATIDFETRSTCDLKACGTWKYSIDLTTQVLCLAYRLPHFAPGRVDLWTPHQPGPIELWDWIRGGGLVEAHNALFERCIWQNIMVARHQWPAIQPHQWRCSAAKAAMCGLPRSLDDALAALGLAERKDPEGYKVMLKMTKPRKPVKRDGPGPHGTLWHDSLELRTKLYSYCQQDVLAEDALSHALPDLPEAEQRIYELDQTINLRGFQLDMDAVATARELIRVESSRLNAELSEMTNGYVTAATQRGKLLAWLSDNGVTLADTTKETVEAALQDSALPVRPRRVLDILSTLGKASTAKYETMQAWAAPDGKVRGSMLYHGAGTGRWTGAGVQPHNFPRGEKRWKDQPALWAALKAGQIQQAETIAALSSGLRGTIVATPGTQLYVADYASIEARVLLWLAEAPQLELFVQGKDIYCHMAGEIYGKVVGPDDAERQVGKMAILGLGYGMGAAKFADSCATAGIPITPEFAQTVVNTYRGEFQAVKWFWYRQEEAAIAATLGNPVTAGPIRWARQGRFLTCQLPSGRLLYYPDPSIEMRETPWGEERAALSFKGVNKYAHQWAKQRAYGGLLVENIVQAVSRDILAEAMLRCEASLLYLPVLSIHDEIVAEAPLGAGSVREFVALLEFRPDWAWSCPIKAEGWTGLRYSKDGKSAERHLSQMAADGKSWDARRQAAEMGIPFAGVQGKL